MIIPNLPSAAYLIPGLKRSLDMKIKRNFDARDIVNEVCRFLDANPEDLRKKTRVHEAVYARHISMYLIRQFTSMTFKSMGILFGNRDHSTCIVAVKAVSDQLSLDYDNDYKHDINCIINNLKGRTIGES